MNFERKFDRWSRHQFVEIVIFLFREENLAPAAGGVAKRNVIVRFEAVQRLKRRLVT